MPTTTVGSLTEPIAEAREAESRQSSSTVGNDLPGQSEDLSLAYEELASLKEECDRLRSLVSQLPGFDVDAVSSVKGSLRIDTNSGPESTLTPTRPLQRMNSDPAGLSVRRRADESRHLQDNPSSSFERDFILRIDQLVWRKARDPREVLEQSNMESLLERISLWERAVRTRYRQRQL